MPIHYIRQKSFKASSLWRFRAYIPYVATPPCTISVANIIAFLIFIYFWSGDLAPRPGPDDEPRSRFETRQPFVLYVISLENTEQGC